MRKYSEEQVLISTFNQTLHPQQDEKCAAQDIGSRPCRAHESRPFCTVESLKASSGLRYFRLPCVLRTRNDIWLLPRTAFSRQYEGGAEALNPVWTNGERAATDRLCKNGKPEGRTAVDEKLSGLIDRKGEGRMDSDFSNGRSQADQEM